VKLLREKQEEIFTLKLEHLDQKSINERLIIELTKLFDAENAKNLLLEARIEELERIQDQNYLA